jgi:hypothetical protein
MEVRVPFSGFYCSIWDSEIDSCVAREVEYLQEEHDDLDEAALGDLINSNISYSTVFPAVAKAYVTAYADWLKDTHEVEVTPTNVELQSPRFYNFETDTLFVDLPYVQLSHLYDKAGEANIASEARRIFTSRSGFISFYDPDIGTWGDLSKWDANQCYCILLALEVEDSQYWFLEALSEDICIAVSNAIDWDAVEQGIQELEDALTGAEPAPYEIPRHGDEKTPADYVAEFCEINHLKV